MAVRTASESLANPLNPLSNGSVPSSASLCEVCFVNTKRRKFDPNFQIISCQKCKKTAHRGCYNQTVAGTVFLCDCCRLSTGSKTERCYYCLNKGLFKSIGNDHYAHPVCFLLYGKVESINYQTLEVRRTSLGSKGPEDISLECELCLKSSRYVQQCYQHRCTRIAHYYCSIKNSSLQQESPWMSLLQMPPKHSHNHEKIRRRIQCPDHVVYCSCQKYLSTTNFIMCDQCLRWYHQPCQGVQITSTSEQQLYFCKLCKKWDNITEQDQYHMKAYPQLFIYDFLKILRVYQKGFNQRILKVIDRFPMKCCTTNFYSNNLREDINRKIEETTELIAISDCEENFKSVDVSVDLVRYFVRFYKGKEENLKSLDSDLSLTHPVSQFHAMLKTLSYDKIINSHPPLKQFLQLYTNPSNYELNITNVGRFYAKIIENAPKDSIDIRAIFKSFIQTVLKVQQRCHMKPNKSLFTNHHRLLFLEFLNYRASQEDLNYYLQAFNILYKINEQASISYYKLRNRLYQGDPQKLKLKVLSLSSELAYLNLPNNLHTYIKNEFTTCAQVFQRLFQKENEKIRSLVADLESMTSIEITRYEEIRKNPQLLGEKLQKQYMVIKTIKHQFEMEVLANRVNDNTIMKIRRFLSHERDRLVIKLSAEDIKMYENYLLQFNTIDDIFQILSSVPPGSMVVEDTYSQKIQYILNYPDLSHNPLPDITHLIHSLIFIQLNRSISSALYKYLSAFIHLLSFSTYPAINLRQLFLCTQLLQIKHQKIELARLQYYSYRQWFDTYVSCYDTNKLGMYFEDIRITKCVKAKLIEGIHEGTGELNVVKEMRFLNDMLLWARITEKIEKEFVRQKPIAENVKDMMQILCDARYPTNISYYTKIYGLYQECLNAERIFEAVFSRINVIQPIDVEVYQELEHVRKKMKIVDIQQFFESLGVSGVDWKVEIKMIEQEIEYFNYNEREAEKVMDSGNHRELVDFFRFFLYQSPFYYERFEELRNKTMMSMCRVVPGTKKEFDQLVKWGGKELSHLYQICRPQILAHKEFQLIQQSLAQNSTIPFPTIQTLSQNFHNLFERDPKRILVHQWVNQYYTLQKICQQVSQKTGPNRYSLQYLQETIERYNKIPIRSEKKRVLYDKIKKYHMTVCEIRSPPLQTWFANRQIQDSCFQKILDLFKILEYQRLLPKPYEKEVGEINQYNLLIRQDPPSSHQEYVSFLRASHLLGQRFLSNKFLRQRAKYLVENKKNIRSCLTQSQLREYYLQCVIFSQTEFIQDKYFSQQLSEIVSYINSCKLHQSRREESQSPAEPQWQPFRLQSVNQYNEEDEKEDEDDLEILEERNMGYKVIEIKEEQMDSDEEGSDSN